MKLYSIHKFAKILNITPQTLRNWDKSGKLVPYYKKENGYRYYTEDQLNNLIGKKKNDEYTIGYCRVSNKKQIDDLERQVDAVKSYLIAQGKPFEIITDIGSGINYNKEGLNKLIDFIVKRNTDKIVVLYKDRLLRFGFELIQNFANKFGVEVEIIDNTPKTEEQELVEDLVQIITEFSCKLQGKRANKAKRMIQELTESDD